MNRFRLWSPVLATAALLSVALAQNPYRLHQLKSLKVVPLAFGSKKIQCWVMDSPSKRQEGMMFLKDADVPKHQGMIFVFPADQELGFWMRNTLIPLDIAYIDSKGMVKTVAQMKPYDENPVPSKASVRYALEMKKGDFARLGIKKGTKFAIPASLRAKS